ncbi:MAG: SPASM domain-containing protein [Saprospiraceae bacterium]
MRVNKWNDLARMVKHLTLKKGINALQLLSSYYFSKLLKRPFQWGQPLSVSIEPTTACNLRCPECPSGLRSFTRDTGSLKQDFFRNTIDQLSPTLANMMFYFQGEPFIHPQFLEMVSYAESKGVYTVTSTNGHFLSEQNVQKTLDSNLSRIIISIDGTTQETYEQYRKEGNLQTVIEGAKRLVDARKKRNQTFPYIIFQYLVVRPNEHQIPDIYKLAADIGVDEVRLKTAQVYSYENGNDLIPLQDRYSRYRLTAAGFYTIKNKLLNQCWKMWHACVITWDGLVVPCCFDKDATHRLGDLKLNSFRDIWKGEKYLHFRSQLLRSRKEIDICQNCTEGTRVFAE